MTAAPAEGSVIDGLGQMLAPCPFCNGRDIHVIQKLNHREASCFSCGAVANHESWKALALTPHPPERTTP